MLPAMCCAERKRWVVYGNSFNYSPTSIPAEWHGWLNDVNDYTPTNYDFKKPAYAVDHYQTRTGSALCYQPKGAWAHGEAKRCVRGRSQCIQGRGRKQCALHWPTAATWPTRIAFVGQLRPLLGYCDL